MPGPWRISSAQDELKIWTDLLLLRRRYALVKRTPAADKAARREEAVLLPSQARRSDFATTVKMTLIIALSCSTITSVAQDKLTVVDAYYPLLDPKPGEVFTISSCAGNKELPPAPAPTSCTSENYSLTHLRDIVINRGLASNPHDQLCTGGSSCASKDPTQARIMEAWHDEVKEVRNGLASAGIESVVRDTLASAALERATAQSILEIVEEKHTQSMFTKSMITT
ncbi:hypothetical protein HRG_005912 [Hirsutella rhossiliensis]|uniref:Uncharacterized protein n=1 Tax=Hirsutella rhossiliensis TaxID=111463 RepID=A0A9P8N298_9HYPO|nr:uncharacterized protein HRG_05912 [Hirsutella rhossiliensis]KAH0963402.1 hypothetical protein HRG_05912 [Hirsutella rhossiliensis]